MSASSLGYHHPRLTVAAAKLVIIATGQDFFAGRSKIEGVLKLSDIGAACVTQRRVRVDDAIVT